MWGVGLVGFPPWDFYLGFCLEDQFLFQSQCADVVCGLVDVEHYKSFFIPSLCQIDLIASLHDMLFIINISWIGLAPGEFTASSLMVLGCDWPVPLEPSTELGRRSWVGSAVQAEVPGATIVSLSSNLYYLLWACSIILFDFLV